MLREMEMFEEQGNISAIAKSNLIQPEQGVSATIGLIDKRRIESRNNQSDQLIGSLTVEQDFCNQEAERKIKENHGLSTTKHTVQLRTFQNERSEQGTGDMEQRRLGMPYRHQ
ncbi:MAG: hypothetical protein EZS28_042107, partial [Streblomastix strix]